MKKLFIVAVAALSFAACSKDYNCDCETTDVNGANISDGNFEFEGKKSEAEDFCDGQENTDPNGNVTTCTLEER